MLARGGLKGPFEGPLLSSRVSADGLGPARLARGESKGPFEGPLLSRARLRHRRLNVVEDVVGHVAEDEHHEGRSRRAASASRSRSAPRLASAISLNMVSAAEPRCKAGSRIGAPARGEASVIGRGGLRFSLGGSVSKVTVEAVFFSVLALLFLGMVAMQIAGHRYGLRRGSDELFGSSEGTAAVEAALYALLGPWWPSPSAAPRSAWRRRAAADRRGGPTPIGTAYLRVDLLPAAEQPRIREEMRATSTSRLALLRPAAGLPEGGRRAGAPTRSSSRSGPTRWTRPRARRTSRATLLVLPSLNAMFDVASKRYAALRMHVPMAIFIQLLLIALGCGFFAGIGMARGENARATCT